jgi:hypothetical protein
MKLTKTLIWWTQCIEGGPLAFPASCLKVREFVTWYCAKFQLHFFHCCSGRNQFTPDEDAHVIGDCIKVKVASRKSLLWDAHGPTLWSRNIDLKLSLIWWVYPEVSIDMVGRPRSGDYWSNGRDVSGICSMCWGSCHHHPYLQLAALLFLKHTVRFFL